MIVCGIAGHSGAGKTTLIERLIPWFAARGLTVSTIKHTHHEFDLDAPGKDTFRHRVAGAREVVFAGGLRWALLAEGQTDADTLLARLAPVDLVLIEGFRAHPYPKLEVLRAAFGRPPIWPGDPTIRALASDHAVTDAKIPVVPLDGTAAVGRAILDIAAPFLPQGRP